MLELTIAGPPIIDFKWNLLVSIDFYITTELAGR